MIKQGQTKVCFKKKTCKAILMGLFNQLVRASLSNFAHIGRCMEIRH